jgi:hypothetical protein
MTANTVRLLDAFKSLFQESEPSQERLDKILASIPGLATETTAFQHYLDKILPEKPAPEPELKITDKLKIWYRKLESGTDEHCKFAIDYSTKGRYLQTLKKKYALTIHNLEGILKTDPDEKVQERKLEELRMFVCRFKYRVDETRKISNEVWRSEIASAEYPEEALRCLERNPRNNYAG